MSDYKDNVDKLGSKSKTVAAILKKQRDDLVDERNELLEALKKAQYLLRSTQYNWCEDCLFEADIVMTEAIEKVTPKPNP